MDHAAPQGERVLGQALAAIDQGVVVQSRDHVVLVCNPRAAELMGVRADEALGRPANTLPLTVRSEQGHAIGTTVAFGSDTFDGAPPADQMLLQLERPDGSYVWVLTSHRPLCDEQGTTWGVATSLFEITERWETTRRLAHMATHDVLTRLPNRYAFEDQLAPALARASRSGAGVLVLFMDLDRFKAVNDELGHAAGDELLRQVSDRLRAVIRGGDLLCRYGGDEFVALVPDLPLDTARRTAERLEKRIGLAMLYAFEVGGSWRRVSISIGSGVFPLDAPDATGLLLCADTEMYRRKTLSEPF